MDDMKRCSSCGELWDMSELEEVHTGEYWCPDCLDDQEYD